MIFPSGMFVYFDADMFVLKRLLLPLLTHINSSTFIIQLREKIAITQCAFFFLSIVLSFFHFIYLSSLISNVTITYCYY